MCGINGIIDHYYPIDRDIIEKMNSVISHRGPDNSGVKEFPNSCIGHVRLSILDIQGSNQPLCNEDGSVWVSFNGEIYNYLEIRDDLISKGHLFRTKGDTETLVHLYEEYGQEMVQHINGMFSFAIWDCKTELLFLARDRIGIKPLYYYQKDNLFIFSSEQKGILTHPDVPREVSKEGLWHYITSRSTPSPFTLYHNINKLPPGHYLLLSKKGASITQYWEIPLHNGNKKCSINNIINKTESLLTHSIRRRMVSDVPIGAFLSGGVDSSLIVALMSKISGSQIKTYSVGFTDFKSNETPFAAQVADYYNTAHNELIINAQIFSEHLEKLTWLRDAPLSEPADVPLYLLSKLASQEVKVLLSGEGSDEIFGGYPKHVFDHLSRCYSKLPLIAKKTLPLCLPEKFRRLQIAVKSMSEANISKRWPLWFAAFDNDEKKILLGEHHNYISKSTNLINTTPLEDCLDHMLFFDCKTWLPDNLLDRGDKMSMGASIETRMPFLDYELIEFAFSSIPPTIKVKRLTSKWIIKEIAKRHLPTHIVHRKKVGFEVPLAQWFRGQLKDLCYGIIGDKNNITGTLLSHKKCMEILDNHCNRRKNNALQIWTLLGLGIWYNTCVKKKGTNYDN